MSPPRDRIDCPWCDSTGAVDTNQQPVCDDHEHAAECGLCGGTAVLYIEEIALMRKVLGPLVSGAGRMVAGPNLPSHTVEELAAAAERVLSRCLDCGDRAAYWFHGEAPQGEEWLEGRCVRCAGLKGNGQDLERWTRGD